MSRGIRPAVKRDEPRAATDLDESSTVVDLVAVERWQKEPALVVDLVAAEARHPAPPDAETVEALRSTVEQFAPLAPPRRAVSRQRLNEELVREVHRSGRSAREGMLAAVSVAEWGQLCRRLGSQAPTALAAAFQDWVGDDVDVLEQHCARNGGGFLLLIPETGLLAGRERLRRLSRRIAGSVLDIAGEHIRVTPVIGFAMFGSANTAGGLPELAGRALDDARRHLDLLPVMYSSALAAIASPPVAAHDRMLAMAERLRSPLQVAFTAALVLGLPFIIYVAVSYSGFDLTHVTYPLVAAALAITATILWTECFRAIGAVDLPPTPPEGFPAATAIVAAYLPNEAATIIDTVTNLLRQNYPGDLQVILAYNSPQRLPVEETLEQIAADDPRLLLLRVAASTSKAQNINAALAHVRGEFVGVFDADHHPAQDSFVRAWRWLASGYEIVQGHCVVRNGEASWVSRMVAAEFETIYAVSHPGRARLHGFGIFGGSNGYWRAESLRQIRMHGEMLTEDIDSSMRSLLDGFSIVSDPGLRSSELAPTTLHALWNQRMRWAQGWTQTAHRHLLPALRSDCLTLRQRAGALFLLGWTQVIPWVTVQVLPILAFAAWQGGGFHRYDYFIPLFVLLTVYTLTVGIAQTVFAYILADPEVKQHKRWFVVYGLMSTVWYGELKNVICRVAQLKELFGERQWRVTPRDLPPGFTRRVDAVAEMDPEHAARHEMSDTSTAS